MIIFKKYCELWMFPPQNWIYILHIHVNIFSWFMEMYFHHIWECISCINYQRSQNKCEKMEVYVIIYCQRMLPILFWRKIEERSIECCLNCPNIIFLICWWWICLEDLLYSVPSDETLLISILWNCGERSKGSKVTFGKCPTWGICRMVHWTFQRCKYWSKIAQIYPFIQMCRSLERKICNTTPLLVTSIFLFEIHIWKPQ